MSIARLISLVSALASFFISFLGVPDRLVTHTGHRSSKYFLYALMHFRRLLRRLMTMAVRRVR